MDLRKFITVTLSTFFYVGYLPFMPGTFGSIAGIILFYAIKGDLSITLIITLCLISIGFWAAGETERMLNKKDAQCIVIDEVSGILISLLMLPYYNIGILVAAFCLFRIFDALKPYPAGRLEKFKGSIGIMGDDIIAGFYTNIILQVVFRSVSLKAS